MKAAAREERWRRVPPVSRSEAERLRLSRKELGQFLAAECALRPGFDGDLGIGEAVDRVRARFEGGDNGVVCEGVAPDVIGRRVAARAELTTLMRA